MVTVACHLSPFANLTAASLGPDGFRDERVDYFVVSQKRDADYGSGSTHGKYTTGCPHMPALPFSQVPTLSPWGASPNQRYQTAYAQSGAILRWAGRQGDRSMYPLEDPVHGEELMTRGLGAEGWRDSM